MATAKKPSAPKKASTTANAAMLADIARSGLTPADARKMQLQLGDAAELGLNPLGAGYRIPYFDFKGKPTGFYRFRYLEDTRTGFEKVSGAKLRRYSQPPNTDAHVYFAPQLAWEEYVTSEDPLIITEGEKKAACACKNGLLAIGLGGVWSFQSSKKGEPLVKELTEISWDGRTVYIVYDSDASENLQVVQAEQRLAHRLLAEGAIVHVLRLPNFESGEKMGLDDYIVMHGVAAFQELCGEATPYNESAALHELNGEVVYIKDPGIVYVLSNGQLVNPEAFKSHRFSDRTYSRIVPTQTGTRLEERSAALDWLKWRGRAALERLEFEPGQPDITESRSLNLWRGWPYEPKRGDLKLWNTLIKHVFNGEEAKIKWFQQWAAYPIQNPGVKMTSAVVVWGRKQGTGKSALGYTLGGLYGEAFAEIKDEHIENVNFNNWAKNKQFVMGDDITGSNSRKLANTLKTMISREKIEINLKFLPQYWTRDCINYYFTANDPDAFLIDENDRRYFINELKGDHLPESFYIEYAAWRKSAAGRAALMYHMLTLDTTDFNPYAHAPTTQDKKEMIGITRTDLEAWLLNVRATPDMLARKFGGSDVYTLGELMAAYDPAHVHNVNSSTLARKLKVLGIERVDPRDKPPNSQLRVGPNGDQVRLYAIRNYSEKWVRCTSEALRQHYEKCRSLKPEGSKDKF